MPRKNEDNIPVELVMKTWTDDEVEEPCFALCWHTYLSSGWYRRFYRREGRCWTIPASIALELIDEVGSLDGLDEKYFDHRGMPPHKPLVSAEMAPDEKVAARIEIIGPKEDGDWGVDPFFVICFDPNDLWKKVLIINTESDIATFRSITEDPQYPKQMRAKLWPPNVDRWLDKSMMHANVQQMRVFQSHLKRYLSV